MNQPSLRLYEYTKESVLRLYHECNVSDWRLRPEEGYLQTATAETAYFIAFTSGIRFYIDGGLWLCCCRCIFVCIRLDTDSFASLSHEVSVDAGGI